jgi:hypothetical protein
MYMIAGTLVDWFGLRPDQIELLKMNGSYIGLLFGYFIVQLSALLTLQMFFAKRERRNTGKPVSPVSSNILLALVATAIGAGAVVFELDLNSKLTAKVTEQTKQVLTSDADSARKGVDIRSILDKEMKSQDRQVVLQKSINTLSFSAGATDDGLVSMLRDEDVIKTGEILNEYMIDLILLSSGGISAAFFFFAFDENRKRILGRGVEERGINDSIRWFKG